MHNRAVLGTAVLVGTLIVGQVIAWLLNASGFAVFVSTLPIILSQIAFWGPIIAILAAAFILVTFRLLGFQSLDEIRAESIEQNNPTPAIVFVGTLIASLLFLSLVIRP